MVVTLEEIQAEAKKLGLALSDDQAKAYVTLNRLPVKEGSSSNSNDDDDDDDIDLDDLEDKKVTQAVRNRINKQNLKHREERRMLLKKNKEAQDKLDKIESDKKAKELKDNEEAGEHKKIADIARAEADKVKAKLEKHKESFKVSAIKTGIRDALLTAGCQVSKLLKAVKLADADNVEFNWTDEDKLTFSLEGIEGVVDSFKKEWPEFFSQEDDDDSEHGRSHNPVPPRAKKKGKETEEERKADLRKQFPALNRVS